MFVGNWLQVHGPSVLFQPLYAGSQPLSALSTTIGIQVHLKASEIARLLDIQPYGSFQNSEVLLDSEVICSLNCNLWTLALSRCSCPVALPLPEVQTSSRAPPALVHCMYVGAAGRAPAP